MKELKPCPFCRGEARIMLEEDDRPNECFHNIYCTSCGVQFWVKSKSEAVEKWNTRPDNWISVEERLPGIPIDPKRENADCLLDCGKKFLTIDDENCIELTTFWTKGNSFANEYVTHWQPLPQPPKGF